MGRVSAPTLEDQMEELLIFGGTMTISVLAVLFLVYGLLWIRNHFED